MRSLCGVGEPGMSGPRRRRGALIWGHREGKLLKQFGLLQFTREFTFINEGVNETCRSDTEVGRRPRERSPDVFVFEAQLVAGWEACCAG
jgi:hypothetical protein